MIDVRCPICKNRHSCMEIGIHASEGCGMFALDDLSKRPQTNADRIRNMDDYDLAIFLENVSCAHADTESWLDWLQEEVTDGEQS